MNTRPTYPALSISQPWAWAILAGHKRVENRTWRTHYRGPLLVHAGTTRRCLSHAVPFLRGQNLIVPQPEDDPAASFRAILGVVEVVDCQLYGQSPELHDDPMAEGPWCWIVDRPRPFPQAIPYAGALGLFGIPRHVLEDAGVLRFMS